MKNIELRDEIYELPENWNELSFDDYRKVMKTLSKGMNSENKSDLRVIVDLLSELTGMDREDLNWVPFEQLSPVVNELMFLINEKPEQVIIENDRIEISGQLFEIREFKDIKVGEAIFIENYLSSNDSPFDVLEHMLSVVMRPVDQEGNVKDVDFDELEDEMQFIRDNLTSDHLYTLSIFFSDQGKSFIQNFLEYFQGTMEEKQEGV